MYSTAREQIGRFHEFFAKIDIGSHVDVTGELMTMFG
jgi:hypothetical protein